MIFTEGLIMLFVIGSSALLGVLSCVMVKGITYYAASTDNMQIVKAASQAEYWGWPSGMHPYANGKAHMKEFAVMCLAFVQRLIHDRTSDFALTCLCFICRSISAVLIFVIAHNYWSLPVALLLFGLYLFSFWPKLIALWGGVVAVAETTFLLSVVFFQWAGLDTSTLKLIGYCLGGFFVGLTLFSSASSRKYIPLSFAAFLWSFQGIRNTDIGLSFEGNFKALLFIGLIVAAWLTLGKLKESIFKQKSFTNFVKKCFAKKDQVKIIVSQALNVSFLSSIYIFFMADISGGFEFWFGHAMTLFGVFIAIFMMTYPNIIKNLKGYYVYSQYGKTLWRSRFFTFREFFEKMGRPIPENFRGAGFRWLIKYFFVMIPIPFILFLIATGLLAISLFHGPIKTINLDSGFWIVALIVSLSPVIMAEASLAVQVGRSYYPAFLGFLFLIGAVAQNYCEHITDFTLYFLALEIVLICHLVWNLWVYLTDVYPSRMAPAFLIRSLRKLGIKKFLTYKSPFNDSFVESIPPDIRKEFDVQYIKNMAGLKDAYVVVPPTNAKSALMYDYPIARNPDPHFEEDLELDRMIESGEIKEKAVEVFKTLNSSRIWIHEGEVPSYRALILNEVRPSDYDRGQGWLLKV